MNKPTFLKWWSAGVGAMDACTGLLLIFASHFTLRLLGISLPSPDATVFLGWIGVFVMSVGLSYGLVLFRPCYGEPVWTFTSLVRISVAVFVTARVADASLEPRWLLVAFADASVAIGQILILRAAWWKEAPP